MINTVKTFRNIIDVSIVSRKIWPPTIPIAKIPGRNLTFSSFLSKEGLRGGLDGRSSHTHFEKTNVCAISDHSLLSYQRKSASDLQSVCLEIPVSTLISSWRRKCLWQEIVSYFKDRLAFVEHFETDFSGTATMESLPQMVGSPPSVAADPPLSKNKLKKQRRDEKWEAGREERKARRKEKMKEKKERKRAEARASRDEAIPPNGIDTGLSKNSSLKKPAKVQGERRHLLPITFVLDCGFEEYMMEKELKSLGSQVTRSYSENWKSTRMAHLIISSFGGQLEERFQGLLGDRHKSWRLVKFLEDDIETAAEEASKWMVESKKVKLTGAFEKHQSDSTDSASLSSAGEVVYLTSDSPNTLSELRPYSTYIVGGLVDHNRHKGLCYKKATNLDIKTAKLPIGEYMQMNSRFVLATNHVIEIMLHWLQSGDWGEAFSSVMPKRKGGVLKDSSNGDPGTNNADDDFERAQAESGDLRDNSSSEVAEKYRESSAEALSDNNEP